MDYYLGEIIIWSASWLPQGFMWCNGALLQVSQYQALFAIIGTTYGGNGSTTFALPDLRGVLPLGVANFSQPGLKAGSPLTLPLSTNQNYATTAPVHLPAHTHSVQIPGTGIAASVASVAIPAVSTLSSPTATPGTTALLSVADDSGIGGAPTIYSTAAASNTTLKPFNITVPGQTTPATTSTTVVAGTVADGLQLAVNNVPGVLGVNYLICVNGIFPSRA